MTTATDRDTLRSAFASDLAVRPCRWSAHNLTVMLRRTGDSPARVAEMRDLLGALGMDQCGHRHSWISMGGVFDHGEMWSRDGVPVVIVGHPYDIDPDERHWLAELARFPGLAVNVDDRPSYYGYGTHHVRVELAEVRRPFRTVPSTPRTGAYARKARRAFAEEFPRVDDWSV